MPQLLPSLPLPPPLTAVEPGTWAHTTVQVRLGEIAGRAISENQFPPDVIKKYHTLIAEISGGAIRQLDEPLAPDREAWETYVSPYLGQSWFEVPWFFAETYFYRRVLEATGYFHPGPMSGYDPFRVQKQLGVAGSQQAILGLRSKVDQSLPLNNRLADLRFLLQADLWGNRADLSLWPVDQESDALDVNQAESFLLADDSNQVAEILLDAPASAKQVAIVVDNAGFEFMVDLVLGDYFLATGAAQVVHFHLKTHPTFVSDATLDDFQETMKFFMNNPAPELVAMGTRLARAQAQGRVVLHADDFWTTPLPAWKMPGNLRAQLAQAAIVFVKGDAHYRRLLGDRHWPFNTSFSKILAYFPAPICALRTLKAEVAAGLDPELIQRLAIQDPTWMTNGRWGMIQVAGG